MGALRFHSRRLLYLQVERLTLASVRRQTGQIDLRPVVQELGSRIDGAVVTATRVWLRTQSLMWR